MKYKFLGKTGIQVSALCMGTMTFGKEANVEASEKIYRKCRENGINFFDTADMYSDGTSETILGNLIQKEREDIILASKVYFPFGKGINQRGLSKLHIRHAIEGSLKRLKTDYLDIYYMHHFDDHADLHETLYAFNNLVQQGKVLYLGVSNFAAWQIMKALGIAAKEHLASIACIQPMYNLLRRQAEVELLPMAIEEKLAVFPYNPLAGGVLTGKYLTDIPSESRLSENKTYQLRYGNQDKEPVQEFIKLAQEHHIHPASLAISWVASHPAVTAPILGARSVEQLEIALKSQDISLHQGLKNKINALTPQPPLATDRNEERSDA